MENRSPLLSEQFAALRAATPSGVAADRRLVNCAIEMIIACLLRLLGQLEQLAQLWQAGALVIPASCATPRQPSRQAHSAARRAPRQRRLATASAASRLAATPRATAEPGATAPARRPSPCPPPTPQLHQPRAPPAPRPPSRRFRAAADAYLNHYVNVIKSTHRWNFPPPPLYRPSLHPGIDRA